MSHDRQQQPSRRTCGQTVAAMIADVPVRDAIAELGLQALTAKQMRDWLAARGWDLARRSERYDVSRGTRQLGPLAALIVVWNRHLRMGGHWSLWAYGSVIDPDADARSIADYGRIGGRVVRFLKVTRKARTS